MLARLCSSALASVRTFVLVLVLVSMRARAFVLCTRIIVLLCSRACVHMFILASCSWLRIRARALTCAVMLILALSFSCACVRARGFVLVRTSTNARA